MLLPKLLIHTSIEIFESIFEYFFEGYKLTKENNNLSYKKSDLLYSGYRYKIFNQQVRSKDSSLKRIGEIDVLTVHENMIDMNAAVYNFGDSIGVLKFFDEVYLMIINRWKYNMTPGLYHWYDGPISGLWVTIGLETGYFNLPEVSQDIIEQIYDSFNYYLKDKIYDSENGFVSPISESEREMIVRKYQSEINKGLPKISDADFPTDTRKPVVREKIRRRFESLKEIKDKNPDLSQVGVVLKYNMNHSEEERIEVYDLQYAYKAMGESWEKK